MNTEDVTRALQDDKNLSGMDLSWVNLSGANLSGTNLTKADLSGSDLSTANLSRANLTEAVLSKADLSRADLFKANLSRANLFRADLSKADLSRADLSNANLTSANFSWTTINKAKFFFNTFPPVSFFMQLYLGEISNDLCLELMRRDAWAHPDPVAFDHWANGDGCPYHGMESARLWDFCEHSYLWVSGPPQMRDADLVLAICKEKGWGIRGYIEGGRE
jgi:uncharacterized protein YjbI with pentapeptide repeats